MPVLWNVDEKRITVRCIDDYPIEEFERGFREIRASPSFRPGMPILLDVRSSAAVVTPEGIERRTEAIAGLAVAGYFARLAIVVPPGPRVQTARRGAAETAQIGFDARVYTDVAEAERWLAEP